MDIEREIFKRGKINYQKLVSYGFIQENTIYHFSKEFMKSFREDITIDLDGNVSGKVYDLKTNLEYTNFRISDLTGFAYQVREEYILLLKDIARNVLDANYFIYHQANRMANFIIEKYKVYPEFLWDKYPGYGIFRNSRSNKWFGIILNVDKSKIIHNLTGEIEIINLKLDDKVLDYINHDGVYPAYHMNKKAWVSVTLDDTLTDEEVMEMVDISYELANLSGSWIIPANPKYYDVIQAFSMSDVITWHQDIKAMEGDFVYIYLTKPYQAILFECKVIEANIPGVNHTFSMKLKLLKKYDEDEFSIRKLKEYGVKAVRSARSIPKKLVEELQK